MVAIRTVGLAVSAGIAAMNGTSSVASEFALMNATGTGFAPMNAISVDFAPTNATGIDFVPINATGIDFAPMNATGSANTGLAAVNVTSTATVPPVVVVTVKKSPIAVVTVTSGVLTVTKAPMAVVTVTSGVRTVTKAPVVVVTVTSGVLTVTKSPVAMVTVSSGVATTIVSQVSQAPRVSHIVAASVNGSTPSYAATITRQCTWFSTVPPRSQPSGHKHAARAAALPQPEIVTVTMLPSGCPIEALNPKPNNSTGSNAQCTVVRYIDSYGRLEAAPYTQGIQGDGPTKTVVDVVTQFWESGRCKPTDDGMKPILNLNFLNERYEQCTRSIHEIASVSSKSASKATSSKLASTHVSSRVSTT